MATTALQRESGRRAPVVVGSLWMVLISIALFFVPAINGLVGGLVGGYKVGGVGRALAAAVLPAAVVAVGMWILFALFDAPLWGVLAGTAVAVLVLLADIGLFIGAAIGGALRGRA